MWTVEVASRIKLDECVGPSLLVFSEDMLLIEVTLKTKELEKFAVDVTKDVDTVPKRFIWEKMVIVAILYYRIHFVTHLNLMAL